MYLNCFQRLLNNTTLTHNDRFLHYDLLLDRYLVFLIRTALKTSYKCDQRNHTSSFCILQMFYVYEKFRIFTRFPHYRRFADYQHQIFIEISLFIDIFVLQFYLSTSLITYHIFCFLHLSRRNFILIKHFESLF